MRGHRAVMVVAGAAVWCAAPLPVTAAPAAQAVTLAGTWGTAITVPGLRALNQGGLAELNSVSCGSAGNCVAVGGYLDASFHGHAFLAGERNGTWRRAIDVPGSEVLNVGGGATATSASCVSAGNCAAGGVYRDGAGRAQAFVVSKTNGTWGTAIEVPGLGTLNKNGNARVESVSCATSGNCAAVGYYVDGSLRFQAFVVSQANGTWGTAIKAPGSGILNAGGNAVLFSVSCRSAGNCAAGGTYTDSTGRSQPLVVTETNGTWGRAMQVPGLAALNPTGDASIGSVSCGSAGNCAAVGGYQDSVGHKQALLVSETNGTWGNAIEVPGSGTLNAGGLAFADSVSCPAAGSCAIGGDYTIDTQMLPFVVSERNGTWGTAQTLLGSATFNVGDYGAAVTVSCATAGNCAAGVTYTADVSDSKRAFVVSETNGTWGTAIEIPGLASLNTGGDAAVTSVSCRSAGSCAAGGTYRDSAGHTQAYVVNQA